MGMGCRGAGWVSMQLILLLVKGTLATQWELTWNDEFDGTSLNTSKWSVRKNESHCCGPLGAYELEIYEEEAVSVHDGYLELNTRWNPTYGPGKNGTALYNYTSGWIDSSQSFAQLQGRFAANCSLPTIKASGIWPAFWLMPDPSAKLCWPTGGEIDIFEMNGNPSNSPLLDETWGSYHWALPGKCGADREPIPGRGARPSAQAPLDWQTGWHVYAVEWFADRLDFYLDDQLYLTRRVQNSTSADDAADGAGGVLLPPAPMYVIFDQAVDQTLNSPKPGNPYYTNSGLSLKVDWVRVYKAAGEEA